jgi:hypothetical protein
MKTRMLTYLNGNIVAVPETRSSNLDRLIGATEGSFGSILSCQDKQAFTKFRKTKTRTGGLTKEQTHL